LKSVLSFLVLTAPLFAQEQREVSGRYPHLAVFNEGNECGIGAVVPWADRLWFLTYSPHFPKGSSDKLYSIGPDLSLVIHPESVGGTPAGRMIHSETQQLIIGPYVIDAAGEVRVVSPEVMPGRLTGVARHLEEPERKVYIATMEEGFYELDLETLEVVELYPDDQGQLRGADVERAAGIPGYHGKGLYSAQGRLVYANNGEVGPEAQRRPDITSGCLAEWDGEAWRVVRRSQFTEVSGPGGIRGNAEAGDPLWSIGWDHRSLVLMLLDGGEWSTFRLPKASHSYDGAHGWNTEWPRIRDVGGDALLMTMHGTFWRFPRGFSLGSTAGIAPHSSYLKVVADFARWEERVVFACDDVARSAFLNKRRAKGAITGPGQSNSNLWIIEPERLDELGPALGRGAVWLDESVEAGALSDPYLFSGYNQRGVHLSHGADAARVFHFEVDRKGDGVWTPLESVEVEAYHWHPFPLEERGAWVRVRLEESAPSVTVQFAFRDMDPRGTEPKRIFRGLARRGDREALGGLMRSRGGDLGTMALVASRGDESGSAGVGFFELNGELELVRSEDEAALAWHEERIGITTGVVTRDAASWLYVDDEGARWRLPMSAEGSTSPLGPSRLCREVVTERDLFHLDGTFYELPARNAGGFARVRPIASHPFLIHDFVAWRGLLVFSGLRPDAIASDHVIRDADGEAGVWVGDIDDLWRLGRPTGVGGPWADSEVEAGVPSDPYLLSAYPYRSLKASHHSGETIEFDIQLDATGTGHWHTWRSVSIPKETEVGISLPPELEAYWLRAVSSADCRATVRLTYR